MKPVNYDFGTNWNTQIVQFLNHPRIIKSIYRGVNGYVSSFDCIRHKQKVQEGRDVSFRYYKAETAPASYCSSDAYMMLMDRLEEPHRGPVPTDEELFQNWIEQKVFTWDDIKCNLETYVLFGSCFWYAPTFELTLARLVEPNESWRVRESKKHATVINREETKIFDLLYWAALGNRLNNYFWR